MVLRSFCQFHKGLSQFFRNKLNYNQLGQEQKPKEMQNQKKHIWVNLNKYFRQISILYQNLELYTQLGRQLLQVEGEPKVVDGFVKQAKQLLAELLLHFKHDQ
ncbi:unnamed protein product [Paramecium primaurelia]|uniref:Uncharacterized protein n=1 Tax=Paramecium primaurelia TaxID=5886 RepID=A0A8S1KJH9_PARPR|nr:unnamed protein product [Paramecium primaurelia]